MTDATRKPVLEIENLCISYFTRAGEIPEFTGISAPYEEPHNAELILDTNGQTVDQSVAQLVAYLEKSGYLGACRAFGSSAARLGTMSPMRAAGLSAPETFRFLSSSR